MPRIARLVAPGFPHHITQRGNYGQTVFFDDNDRQRYLSWIIEYSKKYSSSILVHDLMPNHVHFIAIPKNKDSLARTFNMAHMRYAQYINRKMEKRGHLWQGRFYSCVLDAYHLIAAARYIERNPVRANMVKEPWEWPWSSASAHINKTKSILALDDFLKLVEMSCDSWPFWGQRPF